MFDITLEAIEKAMNYLRKDGKNMYATAGYFKGLNY